MVGKNKGKIDIDTMNLRSHLDASFDIDNIKVSEELIAKTLLAVKASEKEITKSIDTEQEDFVNLVEKKNDTDIIINIDNKRKKSRFLPMKMATIVAAVFVFAIGIYAMNNGIGSQKKTESNNLTKNDSLSGSMTDENDGNGMVYDKMNTSEARVEDTTISSAETENTTEDEKMEMDALSNPESVNADESSQIYAKVNISIISQLYPIENKVISEFTIKDENSKVIRTTKETEVVKEIYEILDEYPLTIGNNNTLASNYQFDILTDDGQSYTILIGNGIFVKTSDELDYTYYEIDNSNELLDKLENFISTMP